MPDEEKPSPSKKPSALKRIVKVGGTITLVMGYVNKYDEFVDVYRKHHILINALLLLTLDALIFVVGTLLLVFAIDVPIVFGMGLGGTIFDMLTGQKYQIHKKFSWMPNVVLILAFVRALYLEYHYGLVGAFQHFFNP